MAEHVEKQGQETEAGTDAEEPQERDSGNVEAVAGVNLIDNHGAEAQRPPVYARVHSHTHSSQIPNGSTYNNKIRRKHTVCLCKSSRSISSADKELCQRLQERLRYLAALLPNSSNINNININPPEEENQMSQSPTVEELALVRGDKSKELKLSCEAKCLVGYRSISKCNCKDIEGTRQTICTRERYCQTLGVELNELKGKDPRTMEIRIARHHFPLSCFNPVTRRMLPKVQYVPGVSNDADKLQDDNMFAIPSPNVALRTVEEYFLREDVNKRKWFSTIGEHGQILEGFLYDGEDGLNVRINKHTNVDENEKRKKEDTPVQVELSAEMHMQHLETQLRGCKRKINTYAKRMNYLSLKKHALEKLKHDLEHQIKEANAELKDIESTS